MATVRVQAARSYWAGIVSDLACTTCDGEGQECIDLFYRWCRDCGGVGVVSPDAEKRHHDFVLYRLRQFCQDVEVFDGSG